MIGCKVLAASAVLVAAAAPVAAGLPISPGEWETKTKVDTVDGSGPMSFVGKMMRGKTTTVEHCVTAEEAARGPQDMLKENRSCTFTRYSVTGGQFDAEMTCQRGSDVTTVTNTGTFTPTTYTGTSQIVTSGRSEMRITGTSTGRWLGPCK